MKYLIWVVVKKDENAAICTLSILVGGISSPSQILGIGTYMLLIIGIGALSSLVLVSSGFLSLGLDFSVYLWLLIRTPDQPLLTYMFILLSLRVVATLTVDFFLFLLVKPVYIST